MTSLPIERTSASAMIVRAGPLAGPLGGDVLVVLVAQVVLERDDRPDERRGLRVQRSAHELQRVAQPLGGDPQLVERRQVRGRDRAVERPHVLVGGPEPGRHPRPDERRRVRRD